MGFNVRGSYSDWINITSGVPQGSVLISSTISTFADDTKQYHIVKSLPAQLALQQYYGLG